MVTAISLNVKCVTRCADYIHDLIHEHNPLFACLQETWHLDNPRGVLDDICENYLYVEKSGVDSDASILIGRPHGGTAILYSKSIAGNVTNVPVASKRVHATKITPCDGTTLIVASVYMPCDNMRTTITSLEYLETINELELLCDKFPTAQILIAGDWYTDVSRQNAQTNYQFISSCALHLCWENTKSEQAYTYESDSLGHKSSIHRFIMSTALFEAMIKCYADTHPLNPSDQRDIILKMKYDIDQVNLKQNSYVRSGIAWHNVHGDHISQYKQLCDMAIDGLCLPMGMLQCDDLNCKESEHLNAINDLCTCMIDITLDSGDKSFPKFKPAGKCLAGWNDRIKPLRDDPLFWHRIWVDCGRSPAGALSMIMRNTRARYHRAVRDLKRNQAELRKSKLADRAASANNEEFWAEVKPIKIYDANASGRPQ